MMKWKNSWVILLFAFTSTYGKGFQYASSVDSVSQTGYNRIELSPELLGKLNAYKGDIRLYHSSGEEVPYVLQREKPVATVTLFHEYEILKNRSKPNGVSYLIFSNPQKKKIDNVSFIVQNTSVSKSARLSGSNDKKNWFIIKDNYLLHSMYSRKTTTELKILNFPLSDYAYFKLEVNDSNSLPIQFQKVGFYDYQSIQGQISSTELSVITKKDSNSTSYVHLQFPERTFVEDIRFTITGAEFYQRNARLKVKKRRRTKRKKMVTYYETIANFQFNSNSENIVHLRGLNIHDVYLEIDNGDDQALKIELAQATMFKQYLVANLESGSKYTLQFSDKKAHSPNYDLAHFTGNIPKEIPVIQTGQIISLQTENKRLTELDGLFGNKYMVWLVIGIVGIGLALVSFKMIKELGQREE